MYFINIGTLRQARNQLPTIWFFFTIDVRYLCTVIFTSLHRWSRMIVASEPSLVIADILCQVLTGSTFLFFFVEPIHGWSAHGIQFFFKFWKNFILIWNKSVFFKKFIFKLFFFSVRWPLQVLPAPEIFFVIFIFNFCYDFAEVIKWNKHPITKLDTFGSWSFTNALNHK